MSELALRQGMRCSALCLGLSASIVLGGCSQPEPPSVSAWEPSVPPYSQWPVLSDPYRADGSRRSGAPTAYAGSPFASTLDNSSPPPPSDPSAGELAATLLAVGIAAAIMADMLSGGDTSSAASDSAPTQQRSTADAEEEDGADSPLSGGLYGNCHGGSFYGCP